MNRRRFMVGVLGWATVPIVAPVVRTIFLPPRSLIDTTFCTRVDMQFDAWDVLWDVSAVGQRGAADDAIKAQAGGDGVESYGNENL